MKVPSRSAHGGPNRRSLLLGGAALFGGATLGVRAAEAWPTKPIRIVCGFPAGGLTDLLARAYGEHLQEQLGKPVIVENRTGASGSIAARAVKSADADGHTLMVTIAAALLQNRILMKNLGYDADKDFARISYMSAGHLPLIVSRGLAVNSVSEFVDLAKTREVSFGSFALGSYAHLAAAALNRRFGLKMNIVQYRGETPAAQDVAGGTLQAACFSYASAKSVLDAGYATAIAVPTTKRLSKLPSVPTFLEQGIDEPLFKTSGFIGLVGPTGIPDVIVERISKLMVEAGSTTRVKRVNETFGIDETALPREDFERIYQSDGPVLLKLVKDLNLAQVDAG